METPNCVICDRNDLVHFASGDYHLNLAPPLQVSRCKNCNLLFMSPRPDETMRNNLFSGQVPKELRIYSEVKANYGEVTDTRASLFNQRLDSFVSTVELPPEEISILDVGASSGTFVELALKKGFNAQGIEPSTDGVNTARLRGISLIQTTAERMPFEDNSFDIVHSHHVFEHLANPMDTAKEVLRVLKPGGFAFIEVPNQLDNIMFFRDRIFGRVHQRKRNIRSIHHLYFFSRRAMDLLFKEAGFIKREASTSYSYKASGIRLLGSWATRLCGLFYLGGDVVRIKAYKK